MMKMTEQNDITHTCSCKPGYLNLSILLLQMYHSTILEQKLNEISKRKNQNTFETSFASVLDLICPCTCLASLTRILKCAIRAP